MQIETMRKKLIEYMEVVDDETIKALYQLLKNSIAIEVEYTQSLNAQLDEAVLHYRKGGEMINGIQAEEEIEKLLK